MVVVVVDRGRRRSWCRSWCRSWSFVVLGQPGSRGLYPVTVRGRVVSLVTDGRSFVAIGDRGFVVLWSGLTRTIIVREHVRGRFVSVRDRS